MRDKLRHPPWEDKPGNTREIPLSLDGDIGHGLDWLPVTGAAFCHLSLSLHAAQGEQFQAAVGGVAGDELPDVMAADVGPGVFRPGVIAEFAGVRNGVEGPTELAGAEIVSANISGRCGKSA